MLAVVVDERRLPVHQPWRTHHTPPEGVGHTLVAQADAQDGNLVVEASDEAVGDAAVGGPAGAGRDDDVRRQNLRHLVGRDLVVAEDGLLRPQFTQVLHQVVCERIVVVNHHYHGLATSPLCLAWPLKPTHQPTHAAPVPPVSPDATTDERVIGRVGKPPYPRYSRPPP